MVLLFRKEWLSERLDVVGDGKWGIGVLILVVRVGGLDLDGV